MVSRNPFHYGTPAEGEHFAGRQLELAALLSRMRNGINVVLISPRRYGKTSLLLRAERELAAESAAVVRVNVLRCRDLGALAGQLTAATYRIPRARWHRVRQAAAAFARRLRVAPTVTFDDDGSPRFSFQPTMTAVDGETILADVYGLLGEETARGPAALVLDEFQAITDHGAHLPGVLKALADEHPEVALVLAGSRTHLMERLVGSSGAPLYGMAERIALGPLDAVDMVAYLQRRAADGRKPMSAEVAAAIVALAGPVPNDIQRLAYESYDVADRRIDRAAVAEGLDRAVAHEAATYAEAFERLPGGQRRVLVALATGPEEAPFSARFATKVGLANAASVKRAISALEDAEIVVRREGRYVVADPFYAAWLRPLAIDRPLT